MPTTLDQHRLAPKSVLRHRPLRADSESAEGVSTPRRSLGSHRSAHASAPQAGLVQAFARRTCLPVLAGLLQAFKRRIWLPVLVGMLAAMLMLSAAQLVISWTATALDDLHYGRPRTYQVDAVVGHQDSAASPSHFLALNLHGRIQIIEWPAGDATHVHVYVGPQLLATGGDLAPVTLSFSDPSRGPVDMLVHIEQSTLIFHNNGQTFQPPT